MEGDQLENTVSIVGEGQCHCSSRLRGGLGQAARVNLRLYEEIVALLVPRESVEDSE
jgi:hypothetical protein